MFILLLLIHTLLTVSHALPTSPSSPSLTTLSSPLVPRDNTCPRNTLHTPTVPEWQWALSTYCARDTPITITPSSPLTFSYGLTAFDGKPIKWLFKVWIDRNVHPTLGHGEDTTPYTYQLSAQTCEERFKAMVTGDKGGDKVVCEYGGNKLFRGGSYREWLEKGYIGQVVWETRQVKGG
ncbi:hypothetical protein yc1106_06818 [Curvularia clavata]|uniref:Uncharacterized protein n=1 Tax=Curvularia clavata TaxID=95742 RepID=A0A9Q8ZBF4_CURCL|nr:hypothetical protein yc1106_06818 [Curvularia clavata]